MAVVLIAPDSAQDILMLTHPRTSLPCHFLLETGGSLCEIITLTQDHPRSLFYGDNIMGDAPISIATPIDATFLLLPCLSRPGNKDRFVAMDALLEEFPERLWPHLTTKFSSVCDALDNDDAVMRGQEAEYWRLSTTKLHDWLRKRVARIQSALPDSIVDALPMQESMHTMARQKAACELISSYLQPSLAEELMTLYNFTPLSQHLGTEQSTGYINPNEFMKRKSEGDALSGPPKLVKKGSKGVESLKKVNTKGMKSMNSFFSKKAAPAPP